MHIWMYSDKHWSEYVDGKMEKDVVVPLCLIFLFNDKTLREFCETWYFVLVTLHAFVFLRKLRLGMVIILFASLKHIVLFEKFRIIFLLLFSFFHHSSYLDFTGTSSSFCE